LATFSITSSATFFGIGGAAARLVLELEALAALERLELDPHFW
jgi:hypothetical protein